MINFSILAKIAIMVISSHSFMTYQKSLAEKGEIRIDESPFKRKRVFSERRVRYWDALN